MPPPAPRSALPVKTSRPSSRNSVVSERVSSGSRTRTLPSRPPGPPPTGGRPAPVTGDRVKTVSGSMVNIAKVSGAKSSRAREADKGDQDLLYSSDSELGSGAIKETVKVVQVKRSNSQMRHKSSESKPRQREAGSEYFETIDSGWTSRDSSSMDRSSSVSLEEKMDELALAGAKMRKGGAMRQSELNLSQLGPASQQLVGFGMLPDQVYSKAVRKGFEFSLMVVGASGLGKSTLVNSMFLTDIYSETAKEPAKPEDQDTQTLRVEAHHRVLVENGVKLSLTVIDTPGFGEAVDNTECWAPILEYVEDRFDAYLEAETRVERVDIRDNRVHACLYFIAPTGHGLKPLDVEVMKKIHKKVNIIPVIGKADSCTVKEVNMFKTKILLQLEKHEIQIYGFPHSELDGDTEHHWMRERMPFAVVGSNTTLTDPETGLRYRGREYPWGCVNIEDKDHCDFLALRNLVLAHHMEDLKETTHKIHYERFRFDKLREMMGGPRDYRVNGADIDDEYRKSVKNFDRHQKRERKNSFLTDIKYKSLESILGGQKVRNMLNSINFK